MQFMTTKFTKMLASSGIALSLALASTACAQAQTAPAAVSDQATAVAEVAPEAMAPAAGAGPALWKVADDDTTIYMFGTVHALPDDVDWYGGDIKQAIDASSVLVTEVNLTPEAMASMQQIVADIAFYKDDTTVRSVLDEDQVAVYEAAMTSLGVPVNAFDKFEPWFAGLTISQLALSKGGFNPQSGSEMVLERTVKEGTKREALETIEFQLGIFDALPQETQIEFLVEGAEEVDNISEYLGKVVDSWAIGDVEGVAEFMNESLESDPELAEALLYARNRTWAEWIDTRLEQPGTIFMAVGAGHLAGEKSVQDYLVERGIQTTRVQ